MKGLFTEKKTIVSFAKNTIMKLGYANRNCKRRKFKPTELLLSVLLFQGKLIIYRKNLEEISARDKSTIKESAE